MAQPAAAVQERPPVARATVIPPVPPPVSFAATFDVPRFTEWTPRRNPIPVVPSFTAFTAEKFAPLARPSVTWSLVDTFVPGDTKTRVLAVQGEPDEAGANVFRYGSSLVFFEDDRVSDWSDGQPRLRILELPRFEFGRVATTFGVGATRSEVVRAQGLPTQTTTRAYYYGASVVFFEAEWVVGWREGDRPLRTRRPAIALTKP